MRQQSHFSFAVYMQFSCSFQFTGTILWSAQLTLFQEEVAWSCVCQIASSAIYT